IQCFFGPEWRRVKSFRVTFLWHRFHKEFTRLSPNRHRNVTDRCSNSEKNRSLNPFARMKTIYLTFVSVLAQIVISTSAQADRLVIKGSDTLGAKLVPQLAEQFKAQHAEATFDN